MPKGIPRDTSTNHAILHRLRIAQGHLTRVVKMVEDGAYCIDIINQSQAVQSALKHADEVIMANHLATCVAEEIKKGNANEVIKEVIQVMNKTNASDHKCCCGTCTCENCTCTCTKDEKTPCTCNCKDCTCNKK